jgi:hypothetical protein
MTAIGLDGNAAAGWLADVFRPDARQRWASARDAVGARPGRRERLRRRHRAGAAVRGLRVVLLRMVRSPGRAWLDLRGLTVLEFDTMD